LSNTEEKINKILEKIPIINRILAWSKRYSPAVFKEVTVYEVVTFVLKEAHKDNLTSRANSVAFSLFLSIFPLILFLFTLLPMLPVVHDYMTTLSEQLRGVIPENAHDYIFSIIYDITSIKRDGLLSLGAFLALVFSSNGMLTLMSGFDKAYHDTFKSRPWWKSRLLSILLTLILSILLIISLVSVVVESHILNYLSERFDVDDGVLYLGSLANKIFSVFLIYTGISLIYTIGPSMHRRMNFINLGSIVATILSLLTSLAFSYFINNFGRYNQLYGSIGALIVLMIWIQFNSFIILVGFELNASLAVQANRKRNQKKEQAQ